ncbi:MAG: restriction endonuclease [Nitrospirae bacterium]|nr:restriction endonuclease [Nitrospirota bacterium]
MILIGYFRDYILFLTNLFLDFWYIGPVVTIIFIVAVCVERWREYKHSGSFIREIDTKGADIFKSHLENIIKKLGYTIEKARQADGNEVAFIGLRDDVRFFIRAVRNRGAVGWKFIEESLKAKRFHRCHGLIVVTNKHFTSKARRLAMENGVMLWDRADLISSLFDAREEIFSDDEARVMRHESVDEFIAENHLMPGGKSEDNLPG